MILYTRNFWGDTVDNVPTRKAYNLSVYSEIGITSLKKSKLIIERAEGHLQKGERLLVAEISFSGGFTFAILDINRPEVLQKLLDSIIAAMAENKSVFYVDDFYKLYGLGGEIVCQ